MTNLIRDDIPFGYTRDADGKVLTRKDSDGYWYEYTRDANGRVLTHKNSRGDWSEYTYDARGNVLTRKNSDGRWSEYTYDACGNELTYRDSDVFNGVLMTKIAGYSYYTLMITEKGQVMAGCQRFDNIQEALVHWDRKDERAILFTEALQKWILNHGE